MEIPEYKKTLKKGNKYGSKKTNYNGRIFDSKREAEFAKHLQYLKHARNLADRVVDIQYQVSYTIKIKNTHICKYIADFVVIYGDGQREVIDVKGFKTAIYKLKKRLVEAQYDITIIEK